MAQIIGASTFRRYFKVKTLMSIFAFASVVWSVGHQITAPARTFGGYRCTQECDVHAAGYKWAQVRDIDDKRQCPHGISPSFHEGCVVFIQNPLRAPDEDDQGNVVGVSIVPPGDR
jgi:hypothetical protein